MIVLCSFSRMYRYTDTYVHIYKHKYIITHAHNNIHTRFLTSDAFNTHPVRSAIFKVSEDIYRNLR